MAHEYIDIKDDKKSLALNTIKYNTEDIFRRYGKTPLESLDNKTKEALKRSIATIITTHLSPIRNDDYFKKNPGMITNNILEIKKNMESSHGATAGKLFIEAVELSLGEKGLNTIIINQ
ncbi:MAG: hypothetical protein WC694_02310 [Candidatus Paceibacterota bacterium]|jgi:hypothetical protein